MGVSKKAGTSRTPRKCLLFEHRGRDHLGYVVVAPFFHMNCAERIAELRASFPAIRARYLAQAKEIVDRVLGIAYAQFIHAVCVESPGTRKPHRAAYRWMLKLAILGLHYSYPECCIESFIRDYFSPSKLYRAHIGRAALDCEHIPCDDCLNQAGVYDVTELGRN